jgi:gas vesicle protein
MCRGKRNMRNLSWFLVGVGVGTVVSLLVAPRAGEDLREDIASSGRECAANVRQRSRQAVETVSDFADRGRQKINEVVGKGQDAVENGRSQLDDYVERAGDVLTEQRDKL